MVEQHGQVGVGPEVGQPPPDEETVGLRPAFQGPGPPGQIGPEPLARLPAPAGPIRLAERGPALAATAAGQRGGARGGVAVGAAGVVRPGR